MARRNRGPNDRERKRERKRERRERLAKRKRDAGVENLPAWTPFEECTTFVHASPASERQHVESVIKGAKTYRNSRYVVEVTPLDDEMTGAPAAIAKGWLWLSIKNVGGGARHDWRDFQRIKNELADPEREAFEVYPPESRLIDTADQFHLIALPLGVCGPWSLATSRLVSEAHPGGVGSQRRFEPGAVPDDLTTGEQMERLASEAMAREEDPPAMPSSFGRTPSKSQLRPSMAGEEDPE